MKSATRKTKAEGKKNNEGPTQIPKILAEREDCAVDTKPLNRISPQTPKELAVNGGSATSPQTFLQGIRRPFVLAGPNEKRSTKNSDKATATTSESCLLPKFVPRWVRDEFHSDERLWAYADLIFVLKAMVGQPKVKKLFDELKTIHPPSGSSVSTLRGLAIMLQKGLRPFTAQQKLTKEERKRRTKTIDGHAKSLIEALKDFDGRNTVDESAFDLHEALRSMLDRLLADESFVMQRRNEREGSQHPESWRSGYNFALNAVFMHPDLFLNAIRDEAFRWSSQSRVMHKPTEKYAAGVRFRRQLTTYFNARCGRPMKEYTESLVQVLSAKYPYLLCAVIPKKKKT